MQKARNNFLVIALGIILFQGALLAYFGQPFFCECGEIKIWEGLVHSAGNSQQIADWYTFSHIIHGFIFYLFFSLLFPKSRVLTRLVLSMGLEVSWEIAENTPYVIELYRQQALAAGYTGDSILNSLCDTVAMIIGYVMAHKLSVKFIIGIAIVFELFVGYMIHDNLTLNIMNFIHPVEVITQWQSQI